MRKVSDKAFEWYLRAATAGLFSAQYVIGKCYRDGLGVAQNLVLAKKWYQKAAAGRNKDAQAALEELAL